jgi:hypothetical protein
VSVSIVSATLGFGLVARGSGGRLTVEPRTVAAVSVGLLQPPMRRAVELAWESLCAGSLGIGAVVTRHGEGVRDGPESRGGTRPG